MNTKIVVCDLDGVLADEHHRRHFADAKNWEKYFMECDKDLRINTWIEHVIYSFGAFPVFLTGRSIICRTDTIRWINKNSQFLMYKLFTRPIGDHSEVTKFKREFIEGLMEEYEVVLAIDDNIKIIEMYRSLGLNTLHVQYETGDRLSGI